MKSRPWANPQLWENLTWEQRAKALRLYYTTGPCGQSNTVGQDREALRQVLAWVEEQGQ